MDNKLTYERINNSPNFTFSFKKEIKHNVNSINLDELIDFSLGIKTSDDNRFVINNKIDKNCYKLLRGKDVSRYNYKYSEKWIWYKPDLMMEKVGAGPRKLEIFLQEKILIKDVAKELIATLDVENFLTTDTITICFNPKKNINIKFILGLLNSNFIKQWFNSNFEAGLHIKINQMQKIPIPNLNLSNKSDKEAHDILVT